MTELGIYGGTFAPIHRGHVMAARRFYDELSLDRLLVMPAFLPPHKTVAEGDSPIHRLQMATLAFAGDPRQITVSDYEISRGGKSYTYLTLEHFQAPDTRLTFLCGTDMFLTLDQWRCPERIFALARIAHIRRRDEEDEEAISRMTEYYRRSYGATIIDLPCDPIEVSSTEIRERCRREEDVTLLVPEEVASYITAHRLYGSGNREEPFA